MITLWRLYGYITNETTISDCCRFNIKYSISFALYNIIHSFSMVLPWKKKLFLDIIHKTVIKLLSNECLRKTYNVCFYLPKTPTELFQIPFLKYKFAFYQKLFFKNQDKHYTTPLFLQRSFIYMNRASLVP